MPSAIARNCQRTAASWSPKTPHRMEERVHVATTAVTAARTMGARWPQGTRSTSTWRRSTSWPSRSASTTRTSTRAADALVARRRDARRLARVGGRDAEAARGGGPRRARRAQGGDPHRGRAGARRAGRPQAPDHRAAPHRLHGLHGRRGARPRRRARRHVQRRHGRADRVQLGNPERCPHGWPIDTDVEQAENHELEPLSALEPGDARDDRAARRARRRPPALVLRRGARARGRSSSSRRPSPPRASSACGSTAASTPIADKAAAGLFVRGRALGGRRRRRARRPRASASALSTRSHVKSWSSRPKWP